MAGEPSEWTVLDNQAEQLKHSFAHVRNIADRTYCFDLAPEAQTLKTENAKIQYRISVLKRRAEELCSYNCCSSSQTILDVLANKFSAAVLECFPDIGITSCHVTRSTNSKFGDYQCNSAMSICKVLKTQGTKISSVDVAKKIAAAVIKGEVIESLEIAGPGFINICLKCNYISSLIKKMLVDGIQPPSVKKKKVIVDFSSPNIAKEMHVGHLRSTIIGESICRLLEFLGHEVLRLNHVGDWGTQFGMLIAHLEDMFPDYANESPSIKDLQAFYKESKVRFDSDEDFKKRSYNCVVKLQQYEPKIMNAWKLICDVSRNEIQAIYDRLDIKLIERGESFYQEKMKAVVTELEKDEHFYEDEGRKILFYSEFSIPLIIVKSDGGFTYDTSDLAALRYRLLDENADWVVYVVDAGQALHFQCVFKAAEKLGWLKPGVRLDHVEFGVVRGEDKKKFKTRSGDTVRLSDLLDEGLGRSLEKLREKKRDDELSAEELKSAQEAVAYGCIRYADLSHSRTQDYVFSFDKMLDDKGNTAVYLLYALTRIKSIARSAKIDQRTLQLAVENQNIELDHPKEVCLGKMMCRFPEVIISLTEDFMLHKLCEYLYELAAVFTEFYDNCYCIEKDKQSGEIKAVNMSRLLLCEATARVFMQGFHILGLKHVEKM